MYLNASKNCDAFPCHFRRTPQSHLLSFLGPLCTRGFCPRDALLIPLHLIHAPHSLAQLYFLREAFLTPLLSPGPQIHTHMTPCIYTSWHLPQLTITYLFVGLFGERLPHPHKSEPPVRNGSVLSQYRAWDSRQSINKYLKDEQINY